MSWPLTLFFALVTGVVGAIYGYAVAALAAPWLGITSFEGAAGYWALFMVQLAFAGSTVVGAVVCRLAGRTGVLRGVVLSLGAVVLIITALGAAAWAQRDVEPRIGGAAVTVAVEVRLPPGAARPNPFQLSADLILRSGSRPHEVARPLLQREARQEDGSWIVPVALPLQSSEGNRQFILLWQSEALLFDAPIPARPTSLDTGWSAWLQPVSGHASGPYPAGAFSLRYRLMLRGEGPRPPP